MDVKTTFLNGNVKEEIYMDHPIGFVSKSQEDKVCRLKKSMYGLKQYLDHGNPEEEIYMDHSTLYSMKSLIRLP